MRAGIAIIVVRVNEIDADALEALQTFARGVVGCERRANLRIVDRDGAQKDAAAVQIKIAAINPEFPKAKAGLKITVEHSATPVAERNGNVIQVLNRMQIP